MGIFDQLFGGDKQQPPGQRAGQHEAMTDQQAIERYRYMLKTAPPETIEQAHADGFAKLTPEQRRLVGEQLNAEVPDAERAVLTQDDASPRSLARLATRAEVRNPGTMERTFGRLGGGGMGGMMAGSFLGSMAGVVVGSMIAQQFFGSNPAFGGGGESAATATGNEAGANTYDGPVEQASDSFGGDIGGGDSWDV